MDPSLARRKGGGGHTSMDPRIGAGKKREEGWNLPHPKQDECPPFEQGGGKPGLLCALCSFVPPKATIYSGSMHPVPKHAEEDHGSLRTVRSPSSRIVSHPPSVGVEPLSSKDGSQTSRPRCSLVHTFGVDFWTRRNVSHISSRRRLHDPRSSGNETHAQAQALSSPREKRSSKP